MSNQDGVAPDTMEPKDLAGATRMAGSAYQSRVMVERTRLGEVGYRSRLATAEEKMSPERYAIGDVIGDRYEVLAIHRGTMGVVYGTFDRETKLPRALKTLQHRFADNATMRELFTAEATTWVRLEKHPFIVRAHLVRWFDITPYVVTEYIRGREGMTGDLRGWLGHSRLTLSVAAEIALQIAQGMQHTTRKVPGLVHRDLKPANILVDDRGRAMVTDFGLSHAAQADAGTPAYMAPEQWRGEELDQRTDLYAFGCILHEMLTGRRLFGAVSLDDWRTAHLFQVPVPPRELKPELPAELDELVRRCLAKERSARPAGWDAVVNVCARAFHEVTGQPAVLNFSAYELSASELLDAGHSLSALGKDQEALDAFNRALEIDPNNVWAWISKGSRLVNLKRYDEAIACYDRALEIDPSHHTAWTYKGIALNHLERYDEALACCERALEIDPRDNQAWSGREGALFGLKRYEEALAHYDRALEIDPRNAQIWMGKSRALGKLERYDGELACYDRALEIDPKDAHVWILKGLRLFVLKRKDEAVSAYDRALEIDPKNAEVWESKGTALDHLKRYAEAIACYDRALEIDPRNAEVWESKGEALGSLNRYDEAFACCDRALAIDPRAASAWRFKGAALHDLKRYDEAIACYERAIEIDPGDALGWCFKGTALDHLTRYDEAIACYEHALVIDARFEHARESLDRLRSRGLLIVACPRCSKNNPIPVEHRSQLQRCASCGGEFSVDAAGIGHSVDSPSQQPGQEPFLEVVCPKCTLKNRIPVEQRGEVHRCMLCWSEIKVDTSGAQHAAHESAAGRGPGAATAPDGEHSRRGVGTFVDVVCPACAEANRISLDRRGEILRCGTCQQEFTVDATGATQRARSAPRSGRSRSPDQESPRTAPRPADTRRHGDAAAPTPLVEGVVGYAKLSARARTAMEALQGGTPGSSAVTLERASQTTYWVALLIALVPVAWCFHMTNGPLWADGMWLFASTTTFAALLASWFSIGRLIEWRRSVLKPGAFMTAMYLIRFGFDEVRFRALWQVKEFGGTHHHSNGAYTHTMLYFQFPGHREKVRVNGREKAESVLKSFQRSQETLRAALARHDRALLDDLNDLRDLDTSDLGSRRGWHLTAVGLLMALVSLLAALGLISSYGRLNEYHDDRLAWERASAAHTATAMRAYLAARPAGRFSVEAQLSIDRFYAQARERYLAKASGSPRYDSAASRAVTALLDVARASGSYEVVVQFAGTNSVPYDVHESLNARHGVIGVLPVGDAFSPAAMERREARVFGAVQNSFRAVIPNEILSFSRSGAAPVGTIDIEYRVMASGSIYYEASKKAVPERVRPFYPGITFDWTCRIHTRENAIPYEFKFQSRPSDRFANAGGSVYDDMAQSAFQDFERELKGRLGLGGSAAPAGPVATN